MIGRETRMLLRHYNVPRFVCHVPSYVHPTSDERNCPEQEHSAAGSAVARTSIVWSSVTIRK